MLCRFLIKNDLTMPVRHRQSVYIRFCGRLRHYDEVKHAPHTQLIVEFTQQIIKELQLIILSSY
jgi:hypothetical protein